MSVINNIRKDVLCIIIGNGPLESALKGEVNRLGLQSVVVFPGRKSHEEMSIWINASDIFVLPSLNEGNPTVMFEALGCGKPFIGSKVGGVPEIINSREYGILVEPADPADLAEKILFALQTTWSHENIWKYARQFTWKNISRDILEVFSAVSGGAR